jgi:hypothetical protein
MSVARNYFIDRKKQLKHPHFRYGGTSGLITVIAAGTATAGHLYVLRNPSTTKVLHLTRIRIAFVPTVAFGAAQAVLFAAYKLTGHTVAYSGGTAITPAKRRTSHATVSVMTPRIATTAELTAGTQTVASQPLFSVGAHSTLPALDQVWEPRDDHPEVLEANEGLIIRNEILMGASGVGRLFVGIDGFEY